MRPIATVIIPAHNEETTLGRLLAALADAHNLEVLVVCNGCTDRTAEVARAHGARVLEIVEASKTAALRAGFAAATSDTVVLVDADVVISGSGVLGLVEAVRSPGISLAAPVRTLHTARSSWPVRAYLRLWEALPAVRYSLAGRGVLALSPDGATRVSRIPDVLADDLWVFESFSAIERIEVASVTVTVFAPCRVTDLVNRRVRVQRGTEDVEQLFGADPLVRTSRHDLVRTAASPGRVLGLPVLLYVSARARARARALNDGGGTWLRDSSSR